MQTMTKSWVPIALAAVVTACLPSGLPASAVERFKTQAVSVVLSHMTDEDRRSYKLQGHGNPWGEGILVIDGNAHRPEDVRVWAYLADGDRVFCLDRETQAITQDIPTIDAATDEVHRRLGLSAVSRSEIRSRVVTAIARGVQLMEVR